MNDRKLLELAAKADETRRRVKRIARGSTSYGETKCLTKTKSSWLPHRR